MKPERWSLLATAAAVLALVRLISTGHILGTGPVSITLQVAAALSMVWARLTFGLRSFHAAANVTEGALVTHGPYGIVRNPIYAAVVLFTAAAVGAHFELESVLLGLVITGAMLVRIFLEERFLRPKYPEYADYERRVKRLIPFVF